MFFDYVSCISPLHHSLSRMKAEKGKKKKNRHRIPKDRETSRESAKNTAENAEAKETTRTEADYYDKVEQIMCQWRIQASVNREEGRKSLSELLQENNEADEEARSALETLNSTVKSNVNWITVMTFKNLRILRFDPNKVRIAADTISHVSLAGDFKLSPVTEMFVPLIEKMGRNRTERRERDSEEDEKRANGIFGRLFYGLLFLEIVSSMPWFLDTMSPAQKKDWAVKIDEYIQKESGFETRLWNVDSEIKMCEQENNLLPL